MKYPLIYLTLIVSVSTNAAANLNYPILNTDEGYPYKNLIDNTERIALSYTRLGDKVRCSVQVTGKNITHQGEVHIVSSKRFQKAPMASCLTRDIAKILLARLSQ